MAPSRPLRDVHTSAAWQRLARRSRRPRRRSGRPAAARRPARPAGGEHPRPLSRDKLVASLWPESGTADARHLLRESLYILRSALGDDSVLSTGDDLRLNPDRLACDLWEFEAALARDDLEAAVGRVPRAVPQRLPSV